MIFLNDFFSIRNHQSPAAAAAKSLQSCLTPCGPMDCSLPGSSVFGILQAKVLERGAIAFSWVIFKRRNADYFPV